jgi:hypothetical protein
MRRALAPLLLLSAAPLLLVSLYLPWQETPCTSGQGFGSVQGLLRGFSLGCMSLDGWSSGIGSVAAIVCLAAVAVAAAALRSSHARGLPLLGCALSVAYFGLAVGAAVRSGASQQQLTGRGTGLHYAYGAYVGLAAVLVALLAAVAALPQITGLGSRARVAASGAFLGVLVSLLLPWEQFTLGVVRWRYLGIESPPGVVAAVAALFGLHVMWTQRGVISTRVLAGMTALFCGATVAAVATQFDSRLAYGAWIGLSATAALAFLSLRGGVQLRGFTLNRWSVIAPVATSALFLGALFLPWAKTCVPNNKAFGADAGACMTSSAWWLTAGSASALVAIALAAYFLAARNLGVSVHELAATFAVLVATVGFEITADNNTDLAYGSIIGFICAASLVALSAARARPRRLALDLAPLPIAGLTACAGYLVLVVLPWWHALQPRSTLTFAPLSWLTILGVVLAVHLMARWVRQMSRSQQATESLVLLPFALLALAAADLVAQRDREINWGGGIVVSLSLLLALLGEVARQGRVRDFRIPEILRVDRL